MTSSSLNHIKSEPFFLQARKDAHGVTEAEARAVKDEGTRLDGVPEANPSASKEANVRVAEKERDVETHEPITKDEGGGQPDLDTSIAVGGVRPIIS